ncbi:hypothetical protein [Amycolatopsis aidingensis]|uniref:hypothetical protein n=1 Tax=Amycolatopsis aidingensis TaxID=2842453 RepID=UPI001C0BEC65|nr:hypothetical protein [Amycolatopsis aidingensis]
MADPRPADRRPPPNGDRPGRRPVRQLGRGRVLLTPPTARRDRSGRRRLVWLATAALSLLVLLGGVLAGATPGLAAGPAAEQAAAPSLVPRQPAPNPPLPLPPDPPVDTCAPGSADPACRIPTGTTTPAPPPMPLPPPTEVPPPTTCFPGQIGCTPGGPTTAPSSPGEPCTGEDCIPQPTPPNPDPGSPPGGPDGDDDGDSECGLFNITGCIAEAITGVFQDLIDAALAPILDLLGHTVLTTPTLEDLPGLGELWASSWEIVLAVYGGLVLVAGIVVMAHQTLQGRYSIKEIGPRIPVGMIAAALSLFVADKAIRLANALTQAVLGDGVEAPSLGSTLTETVLGALSGSLFALLLGLVLVVLGIGLLLVYVVRVIITLLLVVSGPLFLMCHCLPHTDGLARWWWKALGATLAIQVAQSLVLIVFVRVFLSGGIHLFGGGA